MLSEMAATSPLARMVAAEVRARMAAQRVSGKTLATSMGVSQNYLAKRLRDEAPLTFDDLDLILEHLMGYSEDAWQFIRRAEEDHRDIVL